MARKKETPKPLFAVKHDFVASLDHFLHQSMMLLQTCESVLQLEQVGDQLRPMLEERVKAFRAALVTDDDADEPAA